MFLKISINIISQKTIFIFKPCHKNTHTRCVVLRLFFKIPKTYVFAYVLGKLIHPQNVNPNIIIFS